MMSTVAKCLGETTIEEECLFLTGNGFLRVEHDPEYRTSITPWCSRSGADFERSALENRKTPYSD